LKIPKRVNAALDWVAHNVRSVAAVCAALIISFVIWPRVPLLSAFVMGAVLGGTIVYQWSASRQAALRSDIDDLLRQNGALRREKLTLASGVIAKQTQLTAKLPVISEDPEDTGDQPDGAAARTDPAASATDAKPVKSTKPTPRVDPKSPDRDASVNPATRTQPEAAEPPVDRTAKLPIVPDDPGTT
jgi:hypothetical protein